MTCWTPAHNAELDRLNEAVSTAIRNRRKWMDDHMPLAARYQIGEELFNLENGRSLGVVTKHYRYWADRENPVQDSSMKIDYQYSQPGSMSFDNTSRQIGLRFGNKAELKAKLEDDMRLLARLTGVSAS